MKTFKNPACPRCGAPTPPDPPLLLNYPVKLIKCHRCGALYSVRKTMVVVYEILPCDDDDCSATFDMREGAVIDEKNCEAYIDGAHIGIAWV